MKYAILGGAFDPLHSEHMALIEGIIASKLCDKIILVPSYNPPHKSKKLVDFDKRVAMLSIYVNVRKDVIIDTIERDAGLEDSFAYKIIPKIKEKYGNHEYFYAIGGDSMIM
ncbi:MAG: adenylyltransferase/cytidyltransferase family protein, partial [Bacillota bacterium]